MTLLITEDAMTYSRSLTHADDAHEALRQLAHTTRRIEDPTTIYPMLGELSAALNDLAQALHQIAGVHDAQVTQQVTVGGDHRAGRAASYQVAWDLHRAAEMLGQIAGGIDQAHQIEAQITYDIRPTPSLEAVPQCDRDTGMSL